ncbi:MAG TPA: MoxR family ATPase [Candidatus Wallbacteria bacterium]|nr:MoxR family ATPase [Candidatus Wallbacteria bacterium]
MNIEKCRKLINNLADNVEKAVSGKRKIIELALVGLFARSHILIEDIPGIGKTTLAMALARSINGVFRRIQMTADLLPSDIIGGLVFNPNDQAFEVRWGPIQGNLVLCDEINRATPKTQSALLECMAEGQVTIDRQVLKLDDPFMVIATQNPMEYEGCYILGESQKDRFIMAFKMGYPDYETERSIVRSHSKVNVNADEIAPVLTLADLCEIQAAVGEVKVSESVLEYILNIVVETRRDPRVAVGVSPRGTILLKLAASSFALICGRDHVIFDDVKYIAPYVLTHRLQLCAEQILGENMAEEVVADCISKVPVTK